MLLHPLQPVLSLLEHNNIIIMIIHITEKFYSPLLSPLKHQPLEYHKESTHELQRMFILIK